MGAKCTLKNCMHETDGGYSAHSCLLNLRGHLHIFVFVDAGVQGCVRTHLGVCVYISGIKHQCPSSPSPALCMASCNKNLSWTLLWWALSWVLQWCRVLQGEEEKSESDPRNVSEITIILTTAALQSSRETRRPTIPSHMDHSSLFLWNAGLFTFISIWDKVLPALWTTQSLLNTKLSQLFQMPKGSVWIPEIFLYEAQLSGLDMCQHSILSTQHLLDARMKSLYEESSICPFVFFTDQWDNGYFSTCTSQPYNTLKSVALHMAIQSIYYEFVHLRHSNNHT